MEIDTYGGLRSRSIVAWIVLTVPLAAAAQAVGSSPTAPLQAQALQTATTPVGVPLSELAPDSPERYQVKPGDTLSGLARLFLRSPWRWPQLWAREDTSAGAPLLYPGQLLVLERRSERATLRVEPATANEPPTGLRLSPRLRVQLLPEPALPALASHLIEPFLAEPLIVDEPTFSQSPRIVAAPEGRVLITRGDHAYARGPAGSALGGETGTVLRIFREARPLRDPVTQTVLGHEAHYVGRARLRQPQSERPTAAAAAALPVPAVLEIISAREEIRTGDRLLPEPPRPLMNYLPRAPQAALEGARVAAMHGDAVGLAGQNQVVVINKGVADGLASGHVLLIVKSGAQVSDRTVAGLPEPVQLPDEHNGLLMVFRPFDRLSYALILETLEGVKVGDRVVPAR
jgi:hypothetical protein